MCVYVCACSIIIIFFNYYYFIISVEDVYYAYKYANIRCVCVHAALFNIYFPYISVLYIRLGYCVSILSP